MAGGIFPNYPFELNPKCVIFSIIIIGLFFYKPPEMDYKIKLFISFILFVLSYVSMAWYDYKFDCQKLALKKSASSAGITGYFKPPVYNEAQVDRSKLSSEEIKLDRILISVYHLLILAPIFIYVGLNKNNSQPSSNILIIINFAFAILYHGVRLARQINAISLLHVLVGIIGIYLTVKDNKPNWYYNTLTGIGIYTGIKHGLNLTQLFHNN